MLVVLLLSVSARILLRWAWLHITLMFSIRCDHVTLTWAPLSLLRPRGPGCGGGTWAWAPPGAPAPCWPRPAPGPGPGWHSAGKVSRSGMTGVCNVWQYSGNINRWIVSTCWSVFEFVAEGSCSPHWWWEKLGLFVSISRRQSWKGLQFSPQLMPPPKGSSHIDLVCDLMYCHLIIRAVADDRGVGIPQESLSALPHSALIGDTVGQGHPDDVSWPRTCDTSPRADQMSAPGTGHQQGQEDETVLHVLTLRPFMPHAFIVSSGHFTRTLGLHWDCESGILRKI